MSRWHAVEAIDEALEDTKEMLLPFDLSTWTKLAVIVLLTGGAGGSNFFMPGGSGGDYDTGKESTLDETGDLDDVGGATTGAFMNSPGLGAAALGVVATFAIGLAILMLYISSVFEFIYYQSLIEREVKIVDFFSQNTGRGLAYAGFKIVFILGAVLGVGALYGLSLINPLLLLPGFLVGLPLLIFISVFSTLVHDFSLVEMLKADNSILEAIKEVMQEAKSEWKQFGLYVLIKFFIGAAIGIFTVMFGIISLLIVGIPFIILGIAANAVFQPLIIPVALVGVLTWILTLLYVVMVPTKTFTYFYALNVYSRLFE